MLYHVRLNAELERRDGETYREPWNHTVQAATPHAAVYFALAHLASSNRDRVLSVSPRVWEADVMGRRRGEPVTVELPSAA